MRVVLHRRGQPQPAGVQVYPLPQIGDVLRAFIRNTCNVVFVDQQHSSGLTVVCGHLLHIDNSSISDAPNAVKPCTALAFQSRWPLGLSPQECVTSNCNGGATSNNQRIETQ